MKMIECSRCQTIVWKAKIREGEYDCHCPKCNRNFVYIEYRGE